MSNSGILAPNNINQGILYSKNQTPLTTSKLDNTDYPVPTPTFSSLFTSSGTFNAGVDAPNCNLFLFWIWGGGGGSGGLSGAGGTGGSTTLSGGVTATVLGGVGSGVAANPAGVLGTAISGAGANPFQQGSGGTNMIPFGGMAASYYFPNGELTASHTTNLPTRVIPVGVRHPLLSNLLYVPTAAGQTTAPALRTIDTYVTADTVFNLPYKIPDGISLGESNSALTQTSYNSYKRPAYVPYAQGARGISSIGATTMSQGGQGGGFGLKSFQGIPASITITIGAGGTAGSGATVGNVGGGGLVLVEGFVL